MAIDFIEQNGHRHLERAISYASAGWPDHYFEGSMRKARKNFERARALDFDLVTEAIMAPMVERFNQAVYDVLMFGTSFSKTDGERTVVIRAQDVYK